MSFIKQWIHKAGAVSLLIFLMGCVSFASPSSAEEELRIGLLLPLTGEVAATSGEPAVNAARLIVEEINAGGGLQVDRRHYPIRLFIEDHQSNPQIAVRLARKLIAQDSVSVLLGLPESREAIPVATVAEENKVLMISTHSTNPQTTANKQYVFRMPFLDPFQGQLMAEFARHTLDIDRAAVLYDIANPYNKGLAEAFIQAFEAQGGQIVASEIYTLDTNQDFTEQLERIRANQPEALFLPNLTPDVRRQARQAYRLGLEAILLGGDGWNANEFVDEPALQNSFFSELWAPDMPNEKSKQFIARYSERYEIQPSEQAATTYDTFGVLFQAIQTANSLKPADIRQGLLQMGPYDGVSGSILFQDSGDPIRSAVILQIKNNRAETYKVIHP